MYWPRWAIIKSAGGPPQLTRHRSPESASVVTRNPRLKKEPHHGTKEGRLLNCLRGADTSQLRRAVSGEQEQWHPRQVGLGYRGV